VVDLCYRPHSHLALARAGHEDMLRDAEGGGLARSFDEEKPGMLSHLWTHLARKREADPRPVTA